MTINEKLKINIKEEKSSMTMKAATLPTALAHKRNFVYKYDQTTIYDPNRSEKYNYSRM